MDERHQWEALRYVEMNPVRAGLAAVAEDWPWSSARAHTGGADRTGLLEDAAWRKRWLPAEWRETLAEGVANAALIERIRAATRTGRPAADEAFITELERVEGRALRSMKRGPKTRPATDERQLQLEVG